jgi:DNA invertase Pin-like site-specific DNA recombinase
MTITEQHAAYRLPVEPRKVTTPERAALYGRISDDPTDIHTGVTRQLEDGEAVAKRRDFPVFRSYRDDSISALTGKHRPGYEDLMRDAEAGLFTVIVVYHLSRLWRNRVERAGDRTSP